MNFEFADIFVWGAGLMYALGYLFINQIVLRYLVLGGTVLYIIYYSIADDTPLWAAIITSVILGIANLIGLAQIYFRMSKSAIPAKHADIYAHFSDIPPGDFRNIMKIAQRETLSKDETVTKEGDQNNSLYYVLSGTVKITKLGQKFEMPTKHFIGEVAYLTNRKSSATTKLSKGTEIIRWDVKTLKEKSRRNTRFKLALEALISNDLAKKVTYAVAPKGLKSGDQREG